MRESEDLSERLLQRAHWAETAQWSGNRAYITALDAKLFREAAAALQAIRPRELAVDSALRHARAEVWAIAKYIKAHAVEEETSTHVAVYFDEADAARILQMAERFLATGEHANLSPQTVSAKGTDV